MSSDDYILIRTVDTKYVGYLESASCKARFDYPVFTVKTIEEAIKEAQSASTEYGYRFVDL